MPRPPRASAIWCPLPLTDRTTSVISSHQAQWHRFNAEEADDPQFEFDRTPRGRPDRLGGQGVRRDATAQVPLTVLERVAFLCLTASGSIGGQYSYNIVGAVASELHKPPFLVNNTSIGLLFAAYSFPNTVMPLLGGFINDRLGVRVSSQIFATLVFLGSLVIFLAVSLDCDHNARFYLMMLGMAIFGIGAESLNVAQKAMLSSWFADATEFPQLAFAVSCTLTFGYSGAIACRWVAPQMADPSGGAREGAPSGACPQIDTLNATQLPASDNGTLGPNVTHDGGGGGGGADALECADHAAVSRAFALAAGVCAFSTLCVIGAAALHKRDARLVHEGRRRSARRDSSLGAPLMQQKEPAEVRMGTIQSAGSAESSSDGGSLYGGLEAARGGDYGGDYGGGGGASRVSLSVRVQRAVETSSSGLGKLPRCFWWLGGMLAVASGCFNSFEVYGADVLQEHWHFDLQRAGLVSSVFPACGIVFLPIAGALYDQRGGRILGAAIGCAIFTCGWFAITVGSSSHSGGELEHPWAGTPWAATVAVALGAAMFFGGLWPCVPMMVPAANVGVAFGAMTAIQNLALAVGQLAAGALRDHTGNFKATGIFLAGLGAAAMVLGRRAMLSWRAMQEERVANDKAEVGRDFGGAGSVLHASDISISRETIFFDE